MEKPLRAKVKKRLSRSAWISRPWRGISTFPPPRRRSIFGNIFNVSTTTPSATFLNGSIAGRKRGGRYSVGTIWGPPHRRRAAHLEIDRAETSMGAQPPVDVPHPNRVAIEAVSHAAPRLRGPGSIPSIAWLVGAVGIEPKATLKIRKLLILFNRRNARNTGFAQARYTRGTRVGVNVSRQPSCGSDVVDDPSAPSRPEKCG